MANEVDLGTGRVRLQVDASDYDSALQRAENAAAGFGDRAAKAFDTSSGGTKRAAAALLDYVSTLGRTREQVDILTRASKAARAGVDSSIIQAAIDRHEDYQQQLQRTTQAQLEQERTMRAVFASLAAQDDAYSLQERLNAAWEAGAVDAERLAQAERDLAREKREEWEANQRLIDSERQRAALTASLVAQDDAYSQQERLNAAWEAGAVDAERLAQAERDLAREKREEWEANQRLIDSERQRRALTASLVAQDDSYSEQMRLNAAREEGAADAARLAQEERELASAQLKQFNATQDQIEMDRQRRAMVASLIAQADAYEEAERSAARARGEGTDQQQYLQYLRNLSDTAGKSHYEILELKAAQLGLSEAAAPLIDGLKQQSAALGAGGLSAKQYQAALRGMPAQITDIVVSLQGGINPLTVLLQQGGQIKDMFGGIGPAVRAFTVELGKIATNPYVLLTAAVAGLGYAMYTADDIMDDLSLSIIKSGNYAEVTGRQLRDMADAVADAADSSTRVAAEALAAVVGSGQIGIARLAQVSEVAAAAQETLGTKVEDTVKTYIKLGEKPLDTLRELNKAENFLTAAQIERIASLEDQNRMTEAGSEAVAIYLQHQRDVTDAVRESYSPAKSLWVDIKKWVSDATVSVGEFGWATADALAQLAKMRREDGSSVFDLSNVAVNASGSGRDMAELARREQEVYAESRAKVATSIAEAAKQAAKIVDFERETTKLKDGQLSTDEKIAQMSERARNAGVDELRIAQRATAIREADAKKNRKRGDGGGVANAWASEALQGFKDQLTQEQSAIETQTKLLQGQYNLRTIDAEAYYSRMRQLLDQDTAAQSAAIQKQLDYLNQRDVKGRDSANVQKQIGQLEAQQAKLRETTTQRQNDLDNQAEQARQQKLQAERSYRDSLLSTEQALSRQLDTTARRVGMGDRQFEIESRLNDIYNAQADELRQITMQEENRQITAQEAQTKRDTLYASTQRQLQMVTQGYQELARQESSWFNGFNAAWENFKQTTADVAGQAQQTWTNVFTSIGDVAANKIEGIATDWDGMVRQMAASLARSGLNQLLGVAGNYIGSLFGGGASAGAMMGTTNTFGSNMSNFIGYNAKGNTFENNAGLHQYINSIVSKPTMFAKGGAFNVMGEAGPEAIVPLAKSSSGELGVKMMGGNNGMPNITINIMGGDGKAKAGEPKPDGKGGFSIDVIIDQFESKMAGNVLNGTSKLDNALSKKYNLSRGN